jgi:hypothetical protein
VYWSFRVLVTASRQEASSASAETAVRDPTPAPRLSLYRSLFTGRGSRFATAVFVSRSVQASGFGEVSRNRHAVAEMGVIPGEPWFLQNARIGNDRVAQHLPIAQAKAT